ncbi:MAG: NAD-dependent epimerase/dehydratase family protein [Vicinamibacterales bacterium]
MATTEQVILVTGSAGYLGTALVGALAPDYQVVGLDRRPPKDQPAQVAFIECDLTKDESVRNALGMFRHRHGEQMASCVHLAAHYDFSGEPSPLYQTLTIDGTRRLLKGLQDFSVEQFVFSSTHIVMKPAEEGEVITEKSPVDPAWDYPKSKLEAERTILSDRGRIPVVILRLAGVYDADTHVVPVAQQMRRIYEKQFESYFFPGDATHGQAFVHLDDTVACIRKVIERRHQLGPYEVFLVAEPDVVSYADLQEQLGELIHGQEWPTIRIPKTVAKAGAWVQDKVAGGKEEPFIKPWMIELADDHYPIAIDHARRMLDWEATRRLRATLPEMVSRLKRDPEKWYRTNKLEAPESLPKSRASR